MITTVTYTPDEGLFASQTEHNETSHSSLKRKKIHPEYESPLSLNIAMKKWS